MQNSFSIYTVCSLPGSFPSRFRLKFVIGSGGVLGRSSLNSAALPSSGFGEGAGHILTLRWASPKQPWRSYVALLPRTGNLTWALRERRGCRSRIQAQLPALWLYNRAKSALRPCKVFAR